VSQGSSQALGANAAFSIAIRSGAPSHSLEETITHWFVQFREPLFRYALLLTGNAGDSEEAVQEAFLKLHRDLLAGKAIDNVRAWLFRVVHNAVVDRGRSAWRAESLLEQYPAPVLSSPERILLQKEQERELAEAVERLPAVERQCLFLRREGFRYREIASVLDMGETTVTDNIARAIGRLHRELRVRPSK
jgi:RNA polymerase sigma-70 factor (ECF subfamily)